ncbi:4-hydroxyphenylacetate 3-hydroxylase N-terminal domain-containing protein [Pseudomonas chlororaphis]|uniref:4-hydroxyphenylacetate 3-hydroxylase N-terminal domain-containing protein n=1 Tax=Pseudomonas chlororaphis TaxID=587753 RepID=UPI001B30D52B|nr:4-hydroxyphenylacetate 3-hydroxylase N-terminal domain-containing protein [Pseudomonas chlororaphis]
MMKARDMYLQRLSVPRNIWLNGRKVDEVLSEPAFHGAIENTLSYYDLLEESDLNFDYQGRPAAISLMIPKNTNDLARKRSAYKKIADSSFGMLGRTPDFINAGLSAMRAHSAFFGRDEHADYTANIIDFYDRCAREHLFVGHGAINPQIDRSKPMGLQSNLYAGVKCMNVSEQGIEVSGAKMIVTLAPIADQLLIFNMPGLTEHDADYALAFTVPTHAQGLKIICRKSLVHTEGSEFDFPLSSKMDEIDAYLVFDQVHIPWSDVFIFRDIAKSNQFYDVTRTRHHTGHQGVVRGLAKAELLIGVADSLARNLGLSSYINVQEQLGELTTAYELIRGTVMLAELEAQVDAEGVCNPSIHAIQAIRCHFPKWYQQMLQTVQSLAAGSMLAVPHGDDFHNENEGCLQQALQNPFLSPMDRAKLLNLAWDVSGDGFGQRQMIYETYHAGDPMRIAAAHYNNYNKQTMSDSVARALKSHN